MKNTHKVVFSKSLAKTAWNNSELVREINPEENAKLKQKSGRDMLILGSGSTDAERLYRAIQSQLSGSGFEHVYL